MWYNINAVFKTAALSGSPLLTPSVGFLFVLRRLFAADVKGDYQHDSLASYHVHP
jgi:hypothetical protein